jgi:hypothetical protein
MTRALGLTDYNGSLESSDHQPHNEAVQAAISAELAPNHFPAFLVLN